MKRHEALVQLSRDHHYGLLANWKIKKGLSKNIETDRIARYVSKFYEEHLKEHFQEEEELVFPLLGNENPLIQKALKEHQEIHQLAAKGFQDAEALQKFGELLEQHTRFEERQIFQEVQDKVPEEKLQVLLKNSNFKELGDPDFDDKF